MSIWKTREENPKSFSFILEHYKAYDFDNHKDVAAYNIFETGGNPQNPFDENTIRWCYVDDLIAQADKAERLQKAVDAAAEALKYARQRGLDNKATLFAVGSKADKALIEIKQLIKD